MILFRSLDGRPPSVQTMLLHSHNIHYRHVLGVSKCQVTKETIFIDPVTLMVFLGCCFRQVILFYVMHEIDLIMCLFLTFIPLTLKVPVKGDIRCVFRLGGSRDMIEQMTIELK